MIDQMTLSNIHEFREYKIRKEKWFSEIGEQKTWMRPYKSKLNEASGDAVMLVLVVIQGYTHITKFFRIMNTPVSM